MIPDLTLFQDQDALGDRFDANQAFYGGIIAAPIFVERTLSSEEIRRLWLLEKYDGANRVDPAALEMFGSADRIYTDTDRCGGRSFTKSFGKLFWVQ